MYDSSSSLDEKMARDWLHQDENRQEHEAESSRMARDRERNQPNQTGSGSPNEEGAHGTKEMEGNHGEEKVGTRRFPEEEDEDILKESNSRFVLFPIRYREVSCSNSTNRGKEDHDLTIRYGRHIKHHKRVSGPQRSWIWSMICMIGMGR